MTKFIRSFCITIATGLFSLVVKLYNLFYDLALHHDLFSDETIDTFSRNIYVLISVIMLFAFAIKAIESIINPDLLFDSKKGFVSVIKRSVIALVLIVAVPYGFDLFYQVQDEVMGKSLIEKIIIGVGVTGTGESSGNVGKDSGAGKMLASTALSSVLHPKDGDTCVQYEDTAVCSDYNDAIDDISKMSYLIDNINEKDDNDEFILEYEAFGLLSVVIGGVLVYMLALFCIDTALRLVKLGFLEITAPISIVAYIFGGNDILKRWFKEVTSSALSLFGRIAALAIAIFVLSRLPEFILNFDNDTGLFVNLLIIMAVLMFIKEAPSMIERIFGIKIGGKGGISGRLGDMAGVGKIAQEAWGKMRNVGGAALGLAGAGVGALGGWAAGKLGGAIGSGASALDSKLGGKGHELAENIRNNEKVKTIASGARKVSSAAKTAGSVIKAAANAKNPIEASKAASDAYKATPIGIAGEQNKAAKQINEINSGYGIDENGKVIDTKDAKKNFAANTANVKGLNDAQRKAIANRDSANQKKGTLDGIKGKTDNISSAFDTEIASSTGNARMKLQNLKNDCLNGNKSIDSVKSEVANMVANNEISAAVGNGVIKNLDGISNAIKTAGLENTLLSNGAISSSALKAEIKTADAAASLAQSNFDAILNASTDKEKQIMNTCVNASDKINDSYVREISKGSSPNLTNNSNTTGSNNTNNASSSITGGTSTSDSLNLEIPGLSSGTGSNASSSNGDSDGGLRLRTDNSTSSSGDSGGENNSGGGSNSGSGSNSGGGSNSGSGSSSGGGSNSGSGSNSGGSSYDDSDLMRRIDEISDNQGKMMNNQENISNDQKTMMDNQSSMLKNQDTMMNNQSNMMKNQNTMMKNQNTMINNQESIKNDMKYNQEKIDDFMKDQRSNDE